MSAVHDRKKKTKADLRILIVRNIGDVVAVCPPLIIDEDQVDELIAKLSIGLDATLDWAKKSGLMN